jgi:hypothetical protein
LKLVRGFFASPSGAPFDDFCSEELLQELIDSGTGDPFRWSAARIARVLDDYRSTASIIRWRVC